VLRATTLAVPITALAVLGACSSDTDEPQVPNPAAVYCEEEGGTVSGDEPRCTLPDGTTVDAWEHYRASGRDR
jgi:putative hemolysin